MMKLLHILLVFSVFLLPFSANADTGIVGYFKSPTAAEPRPNDIVTFSPTWVISSSFTGKDMDYTEGTSITTSAVGTFTGLYSAPNTYYSKGIVFCDLVHRKAVIPAGQGWPVDIYAAYTSDLTNTDEVLYIGVFIWRGATDSVDEIIGTGQWTGLTTSYTLYQNTETNTEAIDLWPGDRFCVEFYGSIHILSGSFSLTKWAINIRYNHSTYPSKLTYPMFKEETSYELNSAIL